MEKLKETVKDNWVAALLSALAVTAIMLLGAPKGVLTLADNLTDEDLKAAICAEQEVDEPAEPTTEE